MFSRVFNRDSRACMFKMNLQMRPCARTQFWYQGTLLVLRKRKARGDNDQIGEMEDTTCNYKNRSELRFMPAAVSGNSAVSIT